MLFRSLPHLSDFLPTMHVLILGATGPCGILLVQQALEVGHTIVVYVRSPEKLPEDIRTNPRVTVVEGQLTDKAALGQALTGVDAVLSALGPPVKQGITYPYDTPIANGYAVLLEVMRERGVRRLIALGTPSMKDEHDKFSAKFATLVAGVSLFAHGAYKDVVAIGKIIREQGSDLAWTIARVPILTNKSEKAVVAGYIGDGKVHTSLSRVGFAAFCIDQLSSEEWMKKAPLISSP